MPSGVFVKRQRKSITGKTEPRKEGERERRGRAREGGKNLNRNLSKKTDRGDREGMQGDFNRYYI